MSVIDVNSARQFKAIVPSDSVNFTNSVKAIYVGGSGDIVAVDQGGTAILFANVPDGYILPIQTIRINETGTTASNLVALYD